jgi:hypothetical protein
MKNFILFLLLAVIPAACISNDALDGLNLTTSDYLIEPPGLASPDVIVIPKKSFPPEIADSEKFKGKEIVIAPDNLVKAGAPKIDFVLNEDEGGITLWLLEIGAFLAGVASSFIPQLAILEALLTMLSRRKRQHYADAARAILPTNGSVDLKDAMVSVLKALGLKHTKVEPPAPPPQA